MSSRTTVHRETCTPAAQEIVHPRLCNPDAARSLGWFEQIEKGAAGRLDHARCASVLFERC